MNNHSLYYFDPIYCKKYTEPVIDVSAKIPIIECGIFLQIRDSEELELINKRSQNNRNELEILRSIENKNQPVEIRKYKTARKGKLNKTENKEMDEQFKPGEDPINVIKSYLNDDNESKEKIPVFNSINYLADFHTCTAEDNAVSWHSHSKYFADFPTAYDMTSLIFRDKTYESITSVILTPSGIWEINSSLFFPKRSEHEIIIYNYFNTIISSFVKNTKQNGSGVTSITAGTTTIKFNIKSLEQLAQELTSLFKKVIFMRNQGSFNVYFTRWNDAERIGKYFIKTEHSYDFKHLI